ncbi:MAG: methyltransferase domain-containing protein [Deltaproteobacteria bacterium]|nr:methyltransferase domain-containing protein [Candidatus Zymogenaceae bacterium]
MFEALEQINERPGPFEYYTAQDLWTDDYTSQQMLSYHLNGDIDVSSRNTAFIDRSVEWIVSHFKVGAGTKIADFGCGPGLYATRLAKTGAEITGIDFSSRSIQYALEIAIKNGLNINYVNRNYLEFDSDDRFDLILMIMCDFCALSPTQRNEMLAKFFTLLKPRGAVLLDVYSLKAFADRQEQASYEANLLDGFWSPQQYYGFQNTFKYEDEKVVLDKYTIIDPHRTRTVYNWLQYFGPDTLGKEFTENGFVIEDTFSDVAGNSFDPDGSEFAVVAGKG